MRDLKSKMKSVYLTEALGKEGPERKIKNSQGDLMSIYLWAIYYQVPYFDKSIWTTQVPLPHFQCMSFYAWEQGLVDIEDIPFRQVEILSENTVGIRV